MANSAYDDIHMESIKQRFGSLGTMDGTRKVALLQQWLSELNMQLKDIKDNKKYTIPDFRISGIKLALNYIIADAPNQGSTTRGIVSEIAKVTERIINTNDSNNQFVKKAKEMASLAALAKDVNKSQDNIKNQPNANANTTNTDNQSMDGKNYNGPKKEIKYSIKDGKTKYGEIHSIKDGKGNIILGADTIDLSKANKQGARALRHYFRSRGVVVPDVNDVDRDLWYDKFNRWQWAYQDHAIGNTREYLFFTKPDLHITQGYAVSSAKSNKDILCTDLQDDPFFIELMARHPRIVRLLSMSASYDRNPFNCLLSNAVCSKLNMPSKTINVVETGSTMDGANIAYPGTAEKSDFGYDFSLQFNDNADFEVYNFFDAYARYETLKKRGLITPPGGTEGAAKGKTYNTSSNKYRAYKILYDEFSIYKFIVDETERIIYCALFVGVFPTSAPRDTFDDLNPGMITHSVDFHACFVIDNNPLIYAWFNQISLAYRANGKFAGFTEKDGKKGKKNMKRFNNISTPMFSPTGKCEINGWHRDLALVVRTPSSAAKPSSQYQYYLNWYDFDLDERLKREEAAKAAAKKASADALKKAVEDSNKK